jgi:hypothetical protein
MSDLYNSLYEKLEPKRFDKSTPMPMEKIEAGLALEEVLEEGLKKRLIERSGEFFTEEGIIYSPDLIITNSHLRLGEIKLTWMSIRNGITDPKFAKWFTQMACYCYHLQTPYARLYTFFVNGNYKPMSPCIKCWDIEFTGQELRDQWNAVRNHAKAEGLL